MFYFRVRERMQAQYKTFFLKMTALVIGLSVEIPAENLNNETLQACHVYALTPEKSYITPSYTLASPSLHMSSLTSLLDRQMNKIDINILIKLSTHRLVQIYLKEDIVTIRVDNTTASGNMHALRHRRSPIFSLVPRWFWQNASELEDSTPNKVYRNMPDDFSPAKEQQPETVHPLRWWSISIHFTADFIFARLDGTSATVVARSSPEIYKSFPASVRVASSHRAAVMFDCVHGCPIFTSTLDNLFLPLTNTYPVAVIFLCAERGPQDTGGRKTFHLATQTSKCSEGNPLHRQATDEGHFGFSLVADDQREAQCVTVTLSSSLENHLGNDTKDDRDQEAASVCEQLVVQRTASSHPNVTKLELRVGRTHTHVVRVSVHTRTRRGGGPALTVADATEEVGAEHPVVYLHPLHYSNLAVSFDCPQQYLESLGTQLQNDGSSAKPKEPNEGGCSTGVLWGALTLITLVAAVLLLLLLFYIRPNVKDRWKKSSTELDSLSIPETVSVISGRTHQYINQKPFLYPASLASSALLGLHSGMMTKSNHTTNLQHQREAEEVSEPGSPPSQRRGATAPLDFEELCVSALPLLDVSSFNQGTSIQDEYRVFSA